MKRVTFTLLLNKSACVQTVSNTVPVKKGRTKLYLHYVSIDMRWNSILNM